MYNFEYYTPTFIEFGKKSEEKVAQLIKAQNGKKVLIHYGGHSAKKSGLIDKIEKLLTEENIPYVELGGVVPNPRLATVYKGNIIKNLIMDCQSYTKYRPNETTGGIFVSWRRKEELPTGA